METNFTKDISSISNGLVDSGPKQLHEERDNIGDKVKISDSLSIKKEESRQDDNYLFMELIKREKDDLGDSFTEDKPSSNLVPQHLNEESANNDDKMGISKFMFIKKENSEQDDNHPFIELFKQEKDDLVDAFREDKPSSFSFVKLGPDAFKFEHFLRNKNMQDNSDFIAEDFNRSNYSSIKPTQNDVKVENITMTYETKKSNERVFDEWKIKNEEVDIKTEDLEQLQNSMSDTCFGYETHEDLLSKNENLCSDKKMQERSIKKRLTHPIKPGQWFKCCHCNYQTLYKKYIKRHILKHKNPDDVKMFKCNQCDYQTRYKGNLKHHALIHKNPDDIKMFKCDQCNYQTIHNRRLKYHAVRHKNPEDVKMFKCDHCDYQTRYKDVLRKHAVRHKNPGDVKIFKCDHCDYQTRYKSNLKKHALRHKNPDDVEIFKCDECNYQTIHNRRLKNHALRHKNP